MKTGPAALRNPFLIAVVIAELVSFTGSGMTYVALPWFVLATTGSTAHMGWVLAADMLPVALFGIPIGSLITRLGVKRMMNLADAARVPLLALIPVLHWMGLLTYPGLLAIAFLIGCFTAPYMTSSQLILQQVVGEDEQLVAQASAFVQAAMQLTQIVGPLLAGVLIAWRGAPVVLVVNAATYLFSFIVILTFVRAKQPIAPTDESRGALAGLRYVFRDRLLGQIAITLAGVQMAIQGLVMSLPVLVFQRYHRDAHVAGFLFASFGLGAVIGGLVMAHLAVRLPLARIAAFAIVAMAAPLWLLTIRMPWPALVIVLAVFGLLVPFVSAPVIAIVTVRTPEALRPKVLATIMTFGAIAGPLGFVGLGEALVYMPLSSAYLIIAAVFTVSAIAFSIAVRRDGIAPAPIPGSV